MADPKYPDAFTPEWHALREKLISDLFPKGLSKRSRIALDLASLGGDEQAPNYEALAAAYIDHDNHLAWLEQQAKKLATMEIDPKWMDQTTPHKRG